ncbi:MAG: hypothetical protein ACP5F3_02825 [Candidatus Syntrophosphaera sp.]
MIGIFGSNVEKWKGGRVKGWKDGRMDRLKGEMVKGLNLSSFIMLRPAQSFRA